MKNKLITVILIMTALLMLSSCITVIGTDDEPVEGKIISVTKHGNAITDISNEEAEKHGIAPGDIVNISAEGYTAEAPVGTSFSDVDTGETIVLFTETDGIVLAINYGDFSSESGLTEGMEVTMTMSSKEGYMDEYSLRNLIIRSDSRDDFSSDESFANFREITAGDILPGRLYRSSSPVKGTERASYADRLTGEAGIRTVINLADTDESVTEHLDSAPSYKAIVDNGNALMLSMTADTLTPDSAEKLREAVLFMNSHEAPYLIHCDEGMNRAGLVSAFIEALCGANIDEIISDFMASYENYYGVQAGTEQYEKISKTITDYFTNMNGRAFPWNSVGLVAESYAINTLGLSEKDIEILRNNLTK